MASCSRSAYFPDAHVFKVGAALSRNRLLGEILREANNDDGLSQNQSWLGLLFPQGSLIAGHPAVPVKDREVGIVFITNGPNRVKEPILLRASPDGLFRKETREAGIYKEVYVYFLGALIYKTWFVRAIKTGSKIFHSGEGLAQSRKE